MLDALSNGFIISHPRLEDKVVQTYASESVDGSAYLQGALGGQTTGAGKTG